MSASHGFARPLVLIALLWVLGGCGTADPGVRDGQIVFVPAASLPTEPMAGAGTLVLRRCEQTAEGLLVEGFVDARGGVAALLVSGGREPDAGVAVGGAFASQAQLSTAAERPGDFQVTIPWADTGARLQEVDAESLLPGRTLSVIGPAVGCPAA